MGELNMMERHFHRRHFVDTVTFLERQVRIVSDPVFGDIQNTLQNTGSKSANRMKSQIKPRFKGDSFATTVTTIETPAEEHQIRLKPIHKQCTASVSETVCVLL